MVAPQEHPTAHKQTKTTWQRYRVYLLPLILGWLIWGIAGLAFQSATEPLAGSPTEENVVRIAVHIPRSGDYAEFGTSIRDAVQMAITTNETALNEMGYEVELVVYNNELDRRLAMRQSRAIARDPEVLIVIGYMNSTIAEPCLDIYEKYDLAVMTPAITDPSLTAAHPSLANMMLPENSLQASAAAGLIAQSSTSDQQTALLIYDDDVYGQSLASRLAAEAEGWGITLHPYQIDGEMSTETILKTIQDGEYSWVYLATSPSETERLWHALNEAEIEDVHLIGPDQLAALAQIEQDDTASQSLLYTTSVGSPEWYPNGDEFSKLYEAYFGYAPGYYAVEAHDAALLALEAIETTVRREGRRPSREEVARALRDVRINGVTDDALSLTEQGLRRTFPVFIVEANANVVGDGDPLYTVLWLNAP